MKRLYHARKVSGLVFVLYGYPFCLFSRCFVDLCLSFYRFSFGHCVACPSSIYEFWLPIWYLQTLLHFVDRWILLTRKLLNHMFQCKWSSLRHYFECFIHGRHHALINHYKTCVTDYNGYVPFVVFQVRSFVPLLWYINGIFRNLTWRVSLVEKELIKLDAFTCLVQSCCVCYAFHIEMLFVSSQVPFVLKRVYVSFMLFVFIHTYCCPIWFPYQMMSLSFNRNTMGVIS